MTIDFKQLSQQYRQWQANHPKVAGLIVVVESAAVGAAVDILTNGVDFSRDGLKHTATIIGTAVVMAVRNYLKTNASNLKKQLSAEPEPQKSAPTA